MRIKTLQFRMLTRVIIVLLLGVAEKMNAYDISSVCSTGHTLYFNVLEDANCCVELTFPGSSTTHAWDGYEKPSGNVVLPSSIEYNGVFYTIRAIGNSAFRDCSDLLTVSIGNTIVSIEQSAFKGCINLTTVMMNSSVNSIGPNAFQDCNNLASLFIPESVTTIGSRAFYNCSSLYSLSIPDEVNQIGTQAFIGTGWYYNQLDGILYLDNWCLGYKGDGPTGPLELLQGTIGIADYAFSECNGISGELSFPSSIMSIGAGAFYKCNNIYAVTIPNSIRIIESDLFYNCSKLGVIVLPDTIEHIGQHAFTGTAWYNNQPDGVLYLDNWCIRYKNTLPADYVEIAEGTIGIAASAFQSCTELTSVSFPNSLEIIDDYAFYSCRNLVTMSIPNSVIYIGKQAFTMCNSLSGELVIPNSVTYIGGSAFSACNSLASVVLSNSVSTIENSTFASCSELVSIVIPGSISVIGHGAFGGCSNLSGMLSIPNSVVTIGSNAFYGCSSFTESLSIPNSVVFIGHNAFDGCTNLLGSLSIPNSVIYIGKEAFADCTGIEQIMVNESNPYYDSRNNCNGIIETNTNTLICGCKNTIIPNSVTAIGNGAFSVCRGLTSINVPESVTYIGVDAFYVCTGLTSIIIPNSVIVIDDFAFQSCSNLISVIIPSSVTTIGKNVFNHCLSLSSVEVYRNEPSTLGINAFDNTHANLKIYVPYESTNLYKSASNWNNYESCIYPMAYTTIPAYSNATNNWRFVASPLVDNIAPTLVDNMITETDYDLYRFDQSEEAEWQNYKANAFEFVNGQGYLYANAEDVNIIFKGEFNEENTKTVALVYDANAPFVGWNLVGNPFPVSAYVDKSYYTMNEDGTAIEPVAVSMGTAISACTGVMVKAENTGESVTFIKTALEGQLANQGVLQIAVAQNTTRGNSVQDKSIVSFNKGDELSKFVFNKDNAILYIPKGCEHYAIACAEKQGEMPLNLVVKENGSYTISVNPKDVEVKYLHLIDNLKGADVDLLDTPNYSFEAKTSDYASRFRLVFSVCGDADGDNEEPFAFISNGSIIVKGDYGNVMLQIVDLMGRVVVSTEVANNTSINGIASGVYVLRLINGENVRTQKIVVH